MTPVDLLAALRSRGLSLSVEWGQLLVSPRSLLGESDVEAIKANRDALIVLIDPSLAPPAVDDGWEATTDAIADRAFRDEPAWEELSANGWGFCVRESVVLRLEGFPPVAVSPEEAAALDALAAHSKAARERWVKGAKRRRG